MRLWKISTLPVANKGRLILFEFESGRHMFIIWVFVDK